jgi:hypothetical protein
MTLFPAVASAADSTTASVNAHLNAIAWFSGTYHCTGRTAYSNGKARTDRGAVKISKPQNGWMQITYPGQPGSSSFGFDPKKNRYVFVGTGGPGNYGAGYFTVASDKSIVVPLPDVMDNEVYSAGDFQNFTPTHNGYDATASGPSDTYPGVRYKATWACVRQ